MTFGNNILASMIALGLAAVALPSHADWALSADPVAVKPKPEQMQVQPQNPPAFTWSRHPLKPASYTVEVKSGSTVIATYTTKRNFYLPSKAFAAGSYTWRVTPSTVDAWSTPRTFVIDSTSKVFEVPETEVLRSNAVKHPRPRMLAKDFLPAAQWTAQMKTDRGAALTRLTTEVTGRITSLAAIRDTNWVLYSNAVASAARAAQDTDIRYKIGLAARQMEAAALLFRLTGDVKFLNEALLRGDQLASLDPYGTTSYSNQDQATRQIAFSLAKSFDLLYDKIDTARRAAWLKAIEQRITVIYTDLAAGDGRMDQFPFDSHGGSNLGYVAVISALLVNDLPVAQAWFDFATRAFIHSTSVWSGPEGGYSQGTAYGTYSADILIQQWQPLGEALGMNLFNKPWAIGFSNYMMHFLPPGSPGNVFGDEREIIPNWALPKAFAARYATPTAAWYVKNQLGDENELTLLAARYPLPVQTVTAAVAPANAALYPSIGWVAMHSSMADRARTSLYFKSSPYGSYNHSHSDQNSIVLNSGGRRLLIESGYQDYYMSPLVVSWYRQTKAHNAVTYDGGTGQFTQGSGENLGYNGRITAFSTTAGLDYAEGDATPAYGGSLTSAIRKVWYLRNQDAVVVLDKLSAPAAHKFEWNMHAAGPLTADAAGKVTITNVDRSVCLTDLSSGSVFATRSGPPPKAGAVENHGAYVKTTAATSAEFLVVLDVGCKRPAISLSATASGRTLTVGTQTLSLPK
ncbi:heparinase II/III family protein [Massilia sp. MB5]|uniref:heparinase II/III domain-containing protein n=1 Tax=Massilia sp. MB5 TaxID=2919578 RepID=UPI001F113E37|nr:heparinase II/III family protein [Massilia sp. MB5]UMR28359.1 heparinase II/III family protein [Massilia sp. MB5]